MHSLVPWEDPAWPVPLWLDTSLDLQLLNSENVSLQSSYDLDNLRLEQLGSELGLHAEFELEALMLTGQCVDPWTRRRDQVRA